ncbi:MAG: PilZ domain-containing protein [Myxococcales bacterium]|nr:PilZ domain-containing protein [Myxococcales bacterium]
METQVVGEPSQPNISARERRRYPRTLSHVEAVVRTRNGCGRYEVRNLSVCGALLTVGPQLALDTIVEVDLYVAEHPPIRVMARVAHLGVHDAGQPYLGVEFLHRSDETEDEIQALLLDDIERSQTQGRIADLA